MEIDVAVQTGFLFILFSQFQLSFGYLQTAQKNKPQLFLSLNPSINCIDVYHTLRAVSEIIFLKHQSSLLVDEKKIHQPSIFLVAKMYAYRVCAVKEKVVCVSQQGN